MSLSESLFHILNQDSFWESRKQCPEKSEANRSVHSSIALSPLNSVKRHVSMPVFLRTYFALCDKGLIVFTKSVCVYVVVNTLCSPGSHRCLKVDLALVYGTKSVFCSHTGVIVWLGLGSNSFSFFIISVTDEKSHISLIHVPLQEAVFLKFLDYLDMCFLGSSYRMLLPVPFWSGNLFSSTFENSVISLMILPHLFFCSFFLDIP